MVAIVSGSGLGTLNTSLGILGQAGVVGNAQNGNAKESVIINAANGNLVVREKDDFLAGVGNSDLELSRTYNSQATFTDGNGPNWKIGQTKRLVDMMNSYNQPNSTITRIDSDGSATIYRYDTTRELYISTDGDGGYKTIRKMANLQWIWRDEREGAIGQDKNGKYEIYDLANNGGMILSSGDSGGERVRYSYGSDRKLNQIFYSSSTEYVVCHYDSNGNLSYYGLSINGKSKEWIRVYYGYDAQNRLTTVKTDLTPDDNSITDNIVYTTTYTYESSSNRLASITQSDGSYLGFTYDAQQRVKTVTDALSRVTTFDYLTGGKTKVTDPLNKSTVLTYDVKGQLTDLEAPAINGVSQRTHFEYDSNGNVSLVRDPLGLETTYNYDANGNRILERDAAGNTITRVYDLVTNNLLSETRYLTPDPDGSGSAQASLPLTTRYVYNSLNQLRFIVSPEGRVQEYRYNDRAMRASAISYLVNNTTPDPTETALTAWTKGSTVRSASKILVMRCRRMFMIKPGNCGRASTSSIARPATNTMAWEDRCMRSMR
ncbi:MAG: RHS repeat protein [Burkholderiales bacterium]|nr:RHS repeat protein [Burkholderiales bacterium]